jgi:Type II secretion system (T2SS), protein K
MLPRIRNNGIALVSVLWLLLLLSGVAATLSYVVRVQALIAHRTADLTSMRAVEDAAIVDAISKLSDAQTDRHPQIGGAAQNLEFDGISITVSIQDEAGRIDLNSGNDNILLAFLQTQGTDQSAAASLVAALRERQNSHAATETTAYGIGGSPAANPHAPIGSPLDSVDELRQIPQWAAAVDLECWMNSFTVYSGAAVPVASHATESISAALQWLNEHHPTDQHSSIASTAQHDTGNPRSVVGEVFRIRATARGFNDVTTATEWVGRLTGDIDRPILTMQWEHDIPTTAPPCATRPPGFKNVAIRPPGGTGRLAS